MRETKKVAEVDMGAVPGLLERLRARQLGSEDYALIEQMVERLLWLTRLVREGRTKLARLQRMLGFSRSEKTAAVLDRPAEDGGSGNDDGSDDPPAPGGGAADPAPAPAPPDAPRDDTARPAGPKPKVKGHGRRPVFAYENARHIEVAHESLRPGDTCPGCNRGKLYVLDPAHHLRIFGQAPLVALCWDCQRLRCSSCGLVHTARAPEEAQGGKYSESAASVIATLCYGNGMPFHRLEQYQADLQTPVPASTQWEIVAEAAQAVEPVHGELVRQAAQADVFNGDDTHGPVLAFMGKRRADLVALGALDNPERTGLSTTSVVATTAEGRKIALFFSGRNHAGENLAALLEKRAAGLPSPIHMSDALESNKPAGHAVIWCNCLAHGRRNIVDEVANFPQECRHLLEQIGLVFKVDELCRKQKLSALERLERHQRESAPVMAALDQWMKDRFETKQVEPNSGLGKAINYLLKRWDRFTLFLRRPGVPLDNNIAERALKMAIRHRNNSLFYRTPRGAAVGDLFMALIHTAQLCGENPVEYLTALQRHVRAVANSPANWMPWNWRGTLAGLARQRAA
jgi:hypothetical protein